MKISVIHTILLGIVLSSCNFQTPKKNNDEHKVSIQDMAGRSVYLPKEINSIFGSDITTTLFINALAPEKLSGLNFPISKAQKPFLNSKFENLPVLGFIFYGKSTLNLEKLAAVHPDIIVCPIFKHTTKEYIKDFESYGEKLNIPIVMVSLDLEKLPEAFSFMGKLLHKTELVDTLSSYCKTTFDWIESVKKKITKPATVYVAEGNHGLHTIPAHSTHSETIELAGLENCAEVDDDYGYKDMQINMEQIINWQPDYILISSRSFEHKSNTVLQYMQNDKAWRLLNAVQDKKTLIIPSLPYNWIGRPPAINRLLGIKWLASSIYPDLATINLTKEIKEFYNLFYHVNINQEQIKQILDIHHS